MRFPNRIIPSKNVIGAHIIPSKNVIDGARGGGYPPQKGPKLQMQVFAVFFSW